MSGTEWSKYIVLLFLAVCIGYVVHEVAHFAVYEALGYSPIINWRYGSVFTYDASGKAIPETMMPPQDGILTSLAGPFVTLLIAAGFTILYSKRQDSFLFFAIAIISSVSRFNILIYGFNSDEGVISNIMLSSMGRLGRMLGLAVPLIVWTAIIVLMCKLIDRQIFFKRTYWAILLWALVNLALVMLLRVLTTTLL